MTIKIIDNFFPMDEAEDIINNFPKENWENWYKRSDLFQKNQYGCNEYDKMPSKIKNVIDYFNGEEFIEMVKKIFNIENLKKDNHLHGGGIVQYGKKGYLNLHLDYDIHPKTGMERKVNMLYYLNKNWKKDWGGGLKIYDKNKLLDEIFPTFNRLVLFTINDNSIHGFPEPLECPENVFRKSINVYYVVEPEYNIPKRPRAYFFPGPLDKNNIFLNLKKWSKEDYKKRDNYLKNL